MDKVVTISRQFGSGGREIGRKLAQKFNIPFFDNEIITRAAKESGFAETVFHNAESKATNSLLYSLAMGMTAYGGADTGFSTLSLDDQIYLAQAEVIRKVADEGPCVIVGRCADYVLKGRSDVVNVFICADIEFRKKRAIEVEHMSPDKIDEAIKKIDKRRANYYNYHSTEKWGRVENYNIALKSSEIGIDGCVDVIKSYIDFMCGK